MMCSVALDKFFALDYSLERLQILMHISSLQATVTMVSTTLETSTLAVGTPATATSTLEALEEHVTCQT